MAPRLRCDGGITTHQQRSRKNQTPNQDRRILGLGFLTPGEALSFRFPKRQFGKSKFVFRSFQVAWLDSWRWMHCVEDECDLSHLYKTAHHRLYKLERCHTKEGRCFAIWKIPVSPGSCREKHHASRHDQECRRAHNIIR